jgi:hypothetical protein
LHEYFSSFLFISLLSVYIVFNIYLIQFLQQTDPFACLPQQSDPFACLPQQHDSFACLPQQQQQILYCTDSSSQDYLCSSSSNNLIQQISLPQQQQEYICIDNTPSTTLQSTVINQIPICNPLSTNTTSQTFICTPQAPFQQTANIVFQQQQPQIQSQSFQIIQSPQIQPTQYIQVSSGSPQLIQSIQGKSCSKYSFW